LRAERAKLWLEKKMCLHKRIWKVCKSLPTDCEPWGKRKGGSKQCSHGCRFYLPLEDRGENGIGGDWGVCINPKSPRAGLLTFEHQGCDLMEHGEPGITKKEARGYWKRVERNEWLETKAPRYD